MEELNPHYQRKILYTYFAQAPQPTQCGWERDLMLGLGCISENLVHGEIGIVWVGSVATTQAYVANIVIPTLLGSLFHDLKKDGILHILARTDIVPYCRPTLSISCHA